MPSLYEALGIEEGLRKYAEGLPKQPGYTLIQDQEKKLWKTTFRFSVRGEQKEVVLIQPQHVLDQEVISDTQPVQISPAQSSLMNDFFILIQKIIRCVLTPFRWACAPLSKWIEREVAKKEALLDRCLEHFFNPTYQEGWKTTKETLAKQYYEASNHFFANRWPFTSSSFACKNAIIRGLFNRCTCEAGKAIQLAPSATLRFYAQVAQASIYEDILEASGAALDKEFNQMITAIQKSMCAASLSVIRKDFIQKWRPKAGLAEEYNQLYSSLSSAAERGAFNQKLANTLRYPGSFLSVMGRVLDPKLVEMRAVYYNLAAQVELANFTYFSDEHPVSLFRPLDPESHFLSAKSHTEKAKALFEESQMSPDKKREWLLIVEQNLVALKNFNNEVFG